MQNLDVFYKKDVVELATSEHVRSETCGYMSNRRISTNMEGREEGQLKQYQTSTLSVYISPLFE